MLIVAYKQILEINTPFLIYPIHKISKRCTIFWLYSRNNISSSIQYPYSSIVGQQPVSRKRRNHIYISK